MEGWAGPLFHFKMRNPFSKQTGQAAGRGPGATWGPSPIYGGGGDLSSSGGDRQEFGGVATERGGGRGGGQGQRFKAVNGFRVTGITQWTSHSAP